MKKILSLALAVIIIFTAIPVFALNTAVDERIFTDWASMPGDNLSGMLDGPTLINNLNFTDVPGSHWAAEAIVRAGALGLVRGDNRTYSPGASLSNQEAVAFVIRLMGMENAALTEAINIRDQFFDVEGVIDMWSIGYISHAFNIGVITEDEYFSMISPMVGTVQDPLAARAPATRERVARWVAEGLNRTNPGALLMDASIQRVLAFGDWNDINIEYLQSVEALARANVMQGSGGNFNPRASLTRAEMAQILRNADELLYPSLNLERRTGTVGGIRDDQLIVTGASLAVRNFYIRNFAGLVDRIQYQFPQGGPMTDLLGTGIADVVVFRNGQITGLLDGLTPGDEIEYLVSTATGEVLYIQVISEGLQESFVEGRLYAVDTDIGMLTLQDDNRTLTRFFMAGGLYTDEFLLIDQARNPVEALPLGSNVRLRLLGNTIDAISFIGAPIVVTEMRGIVIDNNPDFGYITIFDNNGNMFTGSYFADSIRVSRQSHWDMNDDIGYIAQVFPNFRFDPRSVAIDDVRPGDIVFLRFDPDDPEIIVNLSAASDYIVRYAQIQQITREDRISRVLVRYENGQTAWFDVADNIFVSNGGRPSTTASLMVGDWAQFLISQAILEPGHVVESVREIVVEDGSSHISTIVRGQLAGLEPMQRQMMVQNAQTLEGNGWSNFQNIMPISIAANDIEYFHNGNRISLDYAQRFLRRADGDVYIALENSPQGARARQVTFRDGRDELLPSDTIMHSTGTGSFSILSMPGDITTDAGTIVRRHGRLVPHGTILPSDYAVVSLNGGSRAAVVDIMSAPDVSGVNIARGRVQSVDEGRSFTVQSMSILTGNNWTFTPVQREFTIDHNTMFIRADGSISMALQAFMGFTDASILDDVFTIVYEGSRATRIIEAPFARQAVRGTIFTIGTNDEGDRVAHIRNAEHLNPQNGTWHSISIRDATMTVTIPTNTAVARNNAVDTGQQLVVGDSIRVLTNTLPATMQTGVNVNGYLVFVDR
ncbi:MAG: S-layer homology domain-containing protein [Defluviitaleaceae bacterium]|nr:S-layer homology domain-containing protein [Defluviitaleaceae bacterium]